MAAPSAFADPFLSVEKGQNFNKYYLGESETGERIYEWSSHPPRILHQGQYKDYVLFEDSNIIKLETANAGSLVFNKNSCSYNFHDGGFIDELNTPKIKNISWTVKGKAAASSTWSAVSAINNAACTVSVQTTESTVKITGQKSTASGIFQVVIDYVPGEGIKETMRAYNNNPAWTNHHIGFTETFEVPRIVKFGGQTFDLANHNGTTLNRNWIENNEAKLTKLTDKIFYDFGIGYDNLENIRISWDGNTAKLSMNYLFTNSVVPYQTWFEVDPTFGFATVTTDLHEQALDAAPANCDGRTWTSTLDSTPAAQIDATLCNVPWFYFVLTGVPAGGITVTNATFEYDVTAASSTSQGCVLRNMATNPTTTTNATRYLQALTGDRVSPQFTSCYSVSNNKHVAFNQVGYDAIETSAVGGWYALSLFMNSTSGANQEINIRANDARLSFVYTINPPNPPTGFTATGQGSYVQSSWTASSPVAGSSNGVDAYFIGRSLDNSTFTNKTNVGNVTSYLSTAYWRPNQLYYLNITASDTGVGNSTSAYTSVTTDNYPSAPQNPYVTQLSATSTKLNWSPPSSSGGDTVTGYRVERATGHTCTGSFSILSNFTAFLNYNSTGLTGDQQYCFKISAWNGVGLGSGVTVLRFELPDAVTDLVIGAIGINNVELAWSTPDLNGGTIDGYMVNYTTPAGIPLTVITNDTQSASTTYSITGLTQSTTYCFRVGPWTQYGFNGNGNIVCGTTFTPANFTIGFFDVNATNPNQVPIRYERSAYNASATNLKVIYPNTADLDCVLEYSLAQTSDTYDNITGSFYDLDEDQENFIFQNSGNDIITVDCIDTNTNDTARYVVTQEGSFELLQLIQNWRDGDYGTVGMIGSLDLITVLVVIISMIGFNRVSGQVGIIFNVFLIGVTAYFGIIDFDWIWLPAIVLIAMVVILSTRKDG